MTSLILMTPEPPGSHCAFGGEKIQTGIDLNGNGVLDANEVQETAYVCSAANSSADDGGTGLSDGSNPGDAAEYDATAADSGGQLPDAGGPDATADSGADSAADARSDGGGVSAPGCPVGQASCACTPLSCPLPLPGLEVCTDLQTDTTNCGACGNECTAGDQCLQGRCTVPACPAGNRWCATKSVLPGVYGYGCADVLTDSSNCGACGNVCPGGGSCVEGACQSVCPTGEIWCPEVVGILPMSGCTNPDNDSSNCGGCGLVCPSGTVCMSGSCGVSSCFLPGLCL